METLYYLVKTNADGSEEALGGGGDKATMRQVLRHHEQEEWTGIEATSICWFALQDGGKIELREMAL